MRRDAASSLGEIRDARAMDPLIARLRGDRLDPVGRDGAKALGNVGGTLGMYFLIHALYDDQVEVRVAAADALGKLGDVRAASSLIRAFLKIRMQKYVSLPKRRWAGLIPFIF